MRQQFGRTITNTQRIKLEDVCVFAFFLSVCSVRRICLQHLRYSLSALSLSSGTGELLSDELFP